MRRHGFFLTVGRTFAGFAATHIPKARMNVKTQFQMFAACLLALSAASLTGCQSNRQAGSYSHAAVTVKGRSDAEIRQVTKEVFGEDGYSLVGEGPAFMAFQRPGSRSDALKWGGWYGEGVAIRAKVMMTALADNSCVLQLDMFAVRDASDPVFESESRMLMVNKRPYRQLMDKIGKRLKAQ
jgi:hypothetical protein